MLHEPNSHKTLRQYRKHQEQEKTRRSVRGSDFEDWGILSHAETAPPEQALWRAVILQMITDAISNSLKPDQKRFRRDARHWLTRHSRDFRLVCENAGYQPEWLQAEINRFLALHESDSVPPFSPHSPAASTQFSISYQFSAKASTTSPQGASYENA